MFFQADALEAWNQTGQDRPCRSEAGRHATKVVHIDTDVDAPVPAKEPMRLEVGCIEAEAGDPEAGGIGASVKPEPVPECADEGRHHARSFVTVMRERTALEVGRRTARGPGRGLCADPSEAT